MKKAPGWKLFYKLKKHGILCLKNIKRGCRQHTDRNFIVELYCDQIINSILYIYIYQKLQLIFWFGRIKYNKQKFSKY